MKLMFYMLWYARDGRTLPHNIIGGDAFSCYRSAPSGAGCRGDRESCWVYIGAVYRVGLQNGGVMDRGLLKERKSNRPAAKIGLQATRQSDLKSGGTSGH